MELLLLLIFLLPLLASVAASNDNDTLTGETLAQAELIFNSEPRHEVPTPWISSNVYTDQLDSYLLVFDVDSQEDDSMIELYYFRYRMKPRAAEEDNEPAWAYHRLAGGATNYTITGLTPDTEYKIELVAVESETSFSRVSKSEIHTATPEVTAEPETAGGNIPLAERVPPAPEATCTELSYSSFSITWYPKLNGISPVLNYKLLKRCLSDCGGGGLKNGTWELVADGISGGTTDYQIDGLQPGRKYEFQLVAVNEFGESLPGKITTQEPHGAKRDIYMIPPVLKQVVYTSNTSVLLTWTQLKVPDENISKFQIVCEELHHKRKRRVFNVTDVSLRQFTVPRLRAGKVYKLFMRVYGKKKKARSLNSHAFTCNRTAALKCVSDQDGYYQGDSYHAEDIVYEITSPSANNYDTVCFVIIPALAVAVVFIFGATGCVYRHRQSADQRKKFDADKNFHQQVCAKVANHLCSANAAAAQAAAAPQMEFAPAADEYPQYSDSVAGAGTFPDHHHHHQQHHGGGGGGGAREFSMEMQENQMMLSASHCAATGVAQPEWANKHVF